MDRKIREDFGDDAVCARAEPKTKRLRLWPRAKHGKSEGDAVPRFDDRVYGNAEAWLVGEMTSAVATDGEGNWEYGRKGKESRHDSASVLSHSSKNFGDKQGSWAMQWIKGFISKDKHTDEMV